MFSEAKTRFTRLATAAALIGMAVLTGCQTTATSTSNAPLGTAQGEPAVETVITAAKDPDAIRASDVIARSRDHVTRSGEIYLMRGLADIFSRGMDDMTAKLRAKGYDASNFSYKYWQGVADDIVRRARAEAVSYPIIIMGHSLGGNESSKFANYLAKRGVRVELVVTFDPVETGRVGSNIGEVVNYYLPMDSEDNRVLPAAGFSGKLSNIDVSGIEGVRHATVEKQATYQKQSFERIAAITRAL